MGEEEPDDKDEQGHGSRLGDKDRLGVPGRRRFDRPVADQRQRRAPPQQTREPGASHRAGQLGEHVERNAPTRECVHEPQADRHGGIHMPPAAPAGRAEDQPDEDGPAENTDNGERAVQVGDVKGRGRIAQPPDDRHGNEQKHGGKRELVSGPRQWCAETRSGTQHDLLMLGTDRTTVARQSFHHCRSIGADARTPDGPIRFDDRQNVGAVAWRHRTHRESRGNVMSLIDEALSTNATIADGYDPGRGKPPAPRIAIVTCADPRLTNIGQMLGLADGDVDMIRNFGTVIDDDAVRSLVLSTRLLGSREVMIINHTDCGMLRFTDDEMEDRLRKETGQAPIAPAKFYSFTDAKANTKEQIQKARSHPWISPDVPVRGFVFDVATGRLEEVFPDGEPVTP
jgi:carbonic anhydrase